MRQSQLFTKTRKEAPKDEVAKNAQLLIRAGFIHKELAGAYSYLPLGLRVLNKISNIVRKEMNKIGGQELHMTILQNRKLWEKTKRWSDETMNNWFKTQLKNGTEVGLGITHEEPLTEIMKNHVSSYRDLPILAYQIQTKFRNEERAKSGIIRGREFLMKDLYSFARDKEEHEKLYNSVREAYKKVFKRVELWDKTYITFADGGVFSKYSEEFQTLSDAGEDVIYIDKEKNIAVNEEVYTDEVLKDLNLEKSKLKKVKSIEVANIFSLGTRFSDTLGLNYIDKEESKKPVIIGSYGLGLSRLMGVVAEVLSDKKGLVWPESIAPFKIHLIEISNGDKKVKEYAEELYKGLLQHNKEVLFDDRDVRAGEKFNSSDLIGIPQRAIISKKTMTGGKIEVTNRKTGTTQMTDEAKFYNL